MKSKFFEVVSAAVKDLSDHGYDSEERLKVWLERLHAAARESLVSERELQETLQKYLAQVFRRTVGRLPKVHQGISQFTLNHVKPKLRAELDRRILASANLIKLNRQKAIQETLQRFSGWATSIPIGGSKVVDKKDERDKVRRGIAGLGFVERRVIIDQGHKLIAAINDIVATDGGAIAAIWRHSGEHSPAYDARPEHVARDGKVFVIRDNWAIKKGYMKLAGHQYTDQTEQPGEFVFCRCSYQYLYTVRALPSDMITAKGKEAMLAALA